MAGKEIDSLINLGFQINTSQITTYGNAKWFLLEQYNDVTRELAEKEKILLIDLAKKMPKEEKLFYDFHHYTNEGAVEVAEIIYQELKEFLLSVHSK